MSGRYGNGSDPLAAISTSPAVLATLRRRMTAIELAADTLQVHLASERAQGFVEMLEELKVLKPADIESLYLIIDDAAQARVTALLL
ncbi:MULTISPECIES: hypothetical protein [Pseudomonas]|uniref:Uncharacterized protein n=2 Tax=Pseudomonas TaxID=286 RepID=A0A266ZSI0_PSEFR|nr:MULTISPECIES: hypothetical protein [Pseudomonas]MQT55596.1 hypothetical protein [Pseudomonas sp. FSL R10-2398]MQU19396.1 hypothetical protein [Pseudomonas helleri]MQU61315.1 hypothetical protein [Pseudomonas helleri]PAA03260.1 hypothetical protein CJU81_23335 [Pseudomonas fragi]